MGFRRSSVRIAPPRPSLAHENGPRYAAGGHLIRLLPQLLTSTSVRPALAEPRSRARSVRWAGRPSTFRVRYAQTSAVVEKWGAGAPDGLVMPAGVVDSTDGRPQSPAPRGPRPGAVVKETDAVQGCDAHRGLGGVRRRVRWWRRDRGRRW